MFSLNIFHSDVGAPGILTLRKNKPPAGKIIRCEPGSSFNGSPSLYHVMVGVGVPSALQFSVTGSYLGTITSNGCSVIRG